MLRPLKKKQEIRRDCHRAEETNEIQQLSATWYFGLDPSAVKDVTQGGRIEA